MKTGRSLAIKTAMDIISIFYKSKIKLDVAGPVVKNFAFMALTSYFFSMKSGGSCSDRDSLI